MPPAQWMPGLWTLTLLLASVGCGTEQETSANTLRARFDGTWKSFDTQRTVTLRPIPDEGITLLQIRGEPGDAAPGTGPLDPRSYEITIPMVDTDMGPGPTRLTVDLIVDSPYTGRRSPRTFRGVNNHPNIPSMYLRATCEGPAIAHDAVLRITGQIHLEENSDTRLAGRLFLEATSEEGAHCGEDAVEIDLPFNVERGAVVDAAPGH